MRMFRICEVKTILIMKLYQNKHTIMKLLRHYRILSRPLVFLVTFLFMNFTTDKFNVVAPAKDQTIMIALLLDTSNSMDGLIDQA